MSRLNVGLKVRMLPKIDLRATNAGEFLANMSCDEQAISIAQQGFRAGLFERVIIYFTNQDGRAIDYAAFGVSATGDDNELLAMDADETISMIQRTDKGAAEGVSRMYARLVALGLNPELRFFYKPEIANDPQARARHNAELGLADRDPIEVADGYQIDLWRLTPAKDRGQYFEFGRGRKVR